MMLLNDASKLYLNDHFKVIINHFKVRIDLSKNVIVDIFKIIYFELN